MKPIFFSIPHSGEQVPSEASWLNGLSEPVLMCDVDRYVDQLYLPTLKALQVPVIVTPWHRYVVDLNRLPEDVDADSVFGHDNAPGSFTTGLHWVKTTTGIELMKQPISKELHRLLVEKYFQPFHDQVRAQYDRLREAGGRELYHVDVHSMPSVGTSAHRDPGQERPEIVVSDFNGKSCSPWFTELVMDSYRKAGFQVACNFPYIGGRVTQTYGQPDRHQHAIQVELRRNLYMDEKTKRIWPEKAEGLQAKLAIAVQSVVEGIHEVLN